MPIVCYTRRGRLSDQGFSLSGTAPPHVAYKGFFKGAKVPMLASAQRLTLNRPNHPNPPQPTQINPNWPEHPQNFQLAPTLLVVLKYPKGL